MPWKIITVPKAVYLPTVAADGQFKNTGIRVEPTDKVEIEPGTHNLRVNGAEYQLFVACDTLRLDARNCLILDKPAPPVANISASGGDRAFVGGIGQATAAARGNWDQANASKWRGDEASSIGKGWMEAQIRHADQHGAFDDLDDHDPFETTSGPVEPNAEPNKTLFEERVVRIVTLKDGTQAEALIDPSSGRDAGTASRMYSGIGTDPKEAARLMAEQAREARDVTRKPPEPIHKVAAAPTATTTPLFKGMGTPSGLGPIFDGFLETTLRLQSPGFHLGATTFLQLEEGLAITFAPQWAAAPTCETAFARLHKAAGVVIPLSSPKTTEHVLDLAEHLPALVDVVTETNKAALVIVASWPEGHGLLTRLPAHHLVITRHPTDPRFLTATLLRAHGSTCPHPKTVSWPGSPPSP